MISLALRQVNYMLETKSLNWVSRNTGLTSTALRQLRNTDKPQSATVKTAIKNAYNRESYARLRDIGFSVDQARTYGRKIPEIASAWEANMMMKVAELTGAHVARRIERSNEPVNQETVDKYFDLIYKEVLTGIKKSRVNPEDWLDY